MCVCVKAVVSIDPDVCARLAAICAFQLSPFNKSTSMSKDPPQHPPPLHSPHPPPHTHTTTAAAACVPCSVCACVPLHRVINWPLIKLCRNSGWLVAIKHSTDSHFHGAFLFLTLNKPTRESPLVRDILLGVHSFVALLKEVELSSPLFCGEGDQRINSPSCRAGPPFLARKSERFIRLGSAPQHAHYF